MADTLEEGLTALRTLDWDLGGLLVSGNEAETDTSILMVYDEGLDGVGEIDGDDEELYGDGVAMGHQRLTSRQVTLGLSIVAPGDTEAEQAQAMEDLLHAVRLVTNPLPNRHTATRLLRWRRGAGTAKRLHYRPASGDPVSIPGDAERILYGGADVIVRLECPNPVVTSDLLHTVSFTAGQTREIENLGAFTAGAGGSPVAWSLTSTNPCALTHEDFDEYVLFPGNNVVVNPDRSSTSTAGTDLSYGHAGRLYGRWPLLRPGTNNITASAACTFSWRDTP